MKILHILPDLHTGGAQKFCIDLCNHIAKQGEDDVVLCSIEKVTQKQYIMYKKIDPMVSLYP